MGFAAERRDNFRYSTASRIAKIVSLLNVETIFAILDAVAIPDQTTEDATTTAIEYRSAELDALVTRIAETVLVAVANDALGQIRAPEWNIPGSVPLAETELDLTSVGQPEGTAFRYVPGSEEWSPVVVAPSGHLLLQGVFARMSIDCETDVDCVCDPAENELCTSTEMVCSSSYCVAP